MLISLGVQMLQPAFCFISSSTFSGKLQGRSLDSGKMTRLSMAIKGVQDFDGSFELNEEVQSTLEGYLHHPDMIAEVTKQVKCTSAEFNGELFQPVPYSTNTPHGMPKQFEKFLHSKEYAIVNVPPVIMFKAKVFKPSRLCAVYRVEGLSLEQEAEIEDTRTLFAVPQQATVISDEALQQMVDNPWESIGESLRQTFAEAQSEECDDDDDDLDQYIV